MATFTLSVVGYLDTVPKQAGLSIEQVKAGLEQHRELTPERIQRALTWAERAPAKAGRLTRTCASRTRLIATISSRKVINRCLVRSYVVST